MTTTIEIESEWMVWDQAIKGPISFSSITEAKDYHKLIQSPKPIHVRLWVDGSFTEYTYEGAI